MNTNRSSCSILTPGRAAERSLAAQTARVGVAQAARYPSLTLSGSIGIEAMSHTALGDGSYVWSLLANVTGPIFDAGKRRQEVAAQDAVREQLEATYRQTVLAALQDVENALVSLMRSRERADDLGRAVVSAETAAELARQRYAAGLIDFQSVLDSERTRFTAEDDLAATRTDIVVAVIQLYKAMGGGWHAADPARTHS